MAPKVGPSELDRSTLEPHFQGAKVYRVKVSGGEGQGKSQYYVKLDHVVRGRDSRYLADADFWGIEGDFYQLQSRGSATTTEGGSAGIVEGVEDLAREGHDNFEILYADTSAIVNCGGGTVKKLEELRPDAARALLQRARFFARPEIDVPEYLSTLPDGQHVLVTAPNSTQDYSRKFRVFIGRPGQMREVRVTADVVRYTDGGTTIIDTEEGRLYFPFPSRGESPTFTPRGAGQGQPITLTLLDVRGKDKGVVDTLQVPLKGGSADSARFLCDPAD